MGVGFLGGEGRGGGCLEGRGLRQVERGGHLAIGGGDRGGGGGGEGAGAGGEVVVDVVGVEVEVFVGRGSGLGWRVVFLDGGG